MRNAVNSQSVQNAIRQSPLAKIMQAFCVLHRISWSAPWSETRPCAS